MSEKPLRPTQAWALSLLRMADQPGVVTSDATPEHLLDGQPWVNWQTAQALQRRGLVRIEWIDDGGDIHLTDKGHAAFGREKESGR